MPTFPHDNPPAEALVKPTRHKHDLGIKHRATPDPNGAGAGNARPEGWQMSGGR